jgi:hypothetical protein
LILTGYFVNIFLKKITITAGQTVQKLDFEQEKICLWDTKKGMDA